MTERPDPLTKVTFRGKTMDLKTASALVVLESQLGYELSVTQGCYNAGGVAASGGTHDRGGVVDLAAYQAGRKVRHLRALGFAAWRRLPSDGPWPEHVHAVMIGHQDLSPSAAAQVESYKQGRNGLKDNAIDRNTYHPNVDDFSFRKYWHDKILLERIKGLKARRRALLDKMSALRQKITYRR